FFMAVKPHLQCVLTFFPYTTLFRSRSAAKATDRCRPLHRPPTTGECHDTTPRSSTHPVNRRRRRPAPPGRPLHHLPTRRTRRRQDRKSTRLNSSHVSISYAVFCLKS